MAETVWIVRESVGDMEVLHGAFSTEAKAESWIRAHMAHLNERQAIAQHRGDYDLQEAEVNPPNIGEASEPDLFREPFDRGTGRITPQIAKHGRRVGKPGELWP